MQKMFHPDLYAAILLELKHCINKFKEDYHKIFVLYKVLCAPSTSVLKGESLIFDYLYPESFCAAEFQSGLRYGDYNLITHKLKMTKQSGTSPMLLKMFNSYLTLPIWSCYDKICESYCKSMIC